MLDLELLRSFVSVVDSGGFTRAGERVHRTQSTVSQQIKRLEDDVGQPLLNRNGKDVTPTEAGERLLSYARRLLSPATCWRGRAMRARFGSAFPKISRPIA
jgi:DNA-binding transcriptional LysR family regulator